MFVIALVIVAMIFTQSLCCSLFQQIAERVGSVEVNAQSSFGEWYQPGDTKKTKEKMLQTHIFGSRSQRI